MAQDWLLGGGAERCWSGTLILTECGFAVEKGKCSRKHSKGTASLPVTVFSCECKGNY
jgi:hypothetical protein